MKSMTVHAMINGRPCAAEVEPRSTLLDFLRESLGMTGTKRGCEVGECGACTVLLDGVAVNSCLVLAVQIEGRSVVTVEGLSSGQDLTPLQEAFLDHDAVHCGFCTPGMLMSARHLLDEHPSPDEQEIRSAISGNLCRCTGYVQIVEAIHDAAGREQLRRGTNGEKT
jgi:aerobic carbon-monoxide dehydrogenase small subunit